MLVLCRDLYGIGPMLYVVMASDLKAKSVSNRLAKYADDRPTTLLVPSDSNIGLEEEFANIQQWASINKMKINLAKTTEIVFKRTDPRLSVHPAPVANIEQVRAAKLLGVLLCDSLLFDEHVHAVLKTCSQRIYLMKILRDQGLHSKELHYIFHALVVSKIRYAIACLEWVPLGPSC